jgi:Phosphoglycerol transferase and related proteins, alkaline phosphatase superfamily
MAESAMLTGLVIDAYHPHRVDSIPWRLKPLGYESTAFHTYWGWFYDRRKDFRDLGFDLFMPLETLLETPSFAPFPKDSLLYDQVLRRLTATPSRDFIYAATMETHGGYDFEPLYASPFTSADLPPDAAREVNNFLYLAQSADAALGDFVNQLSTYPEPTVLIYFADHYPAIPKTLNALGLSLEEQMLYETPYFVFANFPLELPKEQPLDADKLTATVLNALGLPLTLAQSIDDEAALHLIKYDAIYGQRLAPKIAGITFDNPDYCIGLTPRLDEARLDDGVLTLRGENLPWRAILRTPTAYLLVIFETDGQTATASLPEEANLGDGGTILFVDDNEEPFAQCEFILR